MSRQADPVAGGIHYAPTLGSPACGARGRVATTSLADQVECPDCVPLIPERPNCPTCGAPRKAAAW